MNNFLEQFNFWLEKAGWKHKHDAWSEHPIRVEDHQEWFSRIHGELSELKQSFDSYEENGVVKYKAIHLPSPSTFVNFLKSLPDNVVFYPQPDRRVFKKGGKWYYDDFYVISESKLVFSFIQYTNANALSQLNIILRKMKVQEENWQHPQISIFSQCDTNAELDEHLRKYKLDQPTVGFLYSLPQYKNEVKIFFGPAGMAVDTKISDGNQLVGTLGRLFRFDDGELMVEHDHFFLSSLYQNLGLATKMNSVVEDIYRKMSVKAIILSANATVGGYAWARQGFDFKYLRDLKRFKQVFINRINKLNMSEESKQELISKIEKFSHAWEFASFNPEDQEWGKHLGKKIMLGASWTAIKYLDPLSESARVGKVYAEARDKYLKEKIKKTMGENNIQEEEIGENGIWLFPEIEDFRFEQLLQEAFESE